MKLFYEDVVNENLFQGDITDLAVSSNNALVASASNDFVIRVVSFLVLYPK